MRASIHHVTGSNVDDAAANRAGRVESQSLVLLDGEDIELTLVHGSLINRVGHGGVDQFTERRRGGRIDDGQGEGDRMRGRGKIRLRRVTRGNEEEMEQGKIEKPVKVREGVCGRESEVGGRECVGGKVRLEGGKVRLEGGSVVGGKVRLVGGKVRLEGGSVVGGKVRWEGVWWEGK